MAVKTHAQIAAEIAANITDNSNKENTAARVREVLNDMNDSYQNSIGGALFYEALYSQNAPVASQTSGTVTIGQLWEIKTYSAGDDFSNWTLISGTAHTVGAVYLATSTAPTTWTNGTDIFYTGEPYVVSTNAAGSLEAFNNTVGAIVLTRNSIGNYSGSKTGAFPQNKTFFNQPVQQNLSLGAASFIRIVWNSANDFVIQTYDSSGAEADGILNYTSISFKVYP